VVSDALIVSRGSTRGIWNPQNSSAAHSPAPQGKATNARNLTKAHNGEKA
jgi:hypothetical protein